MKAPYAHARLSLSLSLHTCYLSSGGGGERGRSARASFGVGWKKERRRRGEECAQWSWAEEEGGMRFSSGIVSRTHLFLLCYGVCNARLCDSSWQAMCFARGEGGGKGRFRIRVFMYGVSFGWLAGGQVGFLSSLLLLSSSSLSLARLEKMPQTMPMSTASGACRISLRSSKARLTRSRLPCVAMSNGRGVNGQSITTVERYEDRRMALLF